MHGVFCIILKSHFLFICAFIDLTSVEETTLVTRMQTAPTPLDHMYAIVSLDVPETDKIAQVNFDRFYLNNREALTMLSSVVKHAGRGWGTKKCREKHET